MKSSQQYIYARVSKKDRTNLNQTYKLSKLYPTAKIYEETASSVVNRPVLVGLIKSIIQPGDTLIVNSLDRLARDVAEAVSMIKYLDKKGITLVSVKENIDYSTPSGRFLTHILCSVAEMERAMISERTTEALRRAKESGVRLGCPDKYTKSQKDRVIELRKAGHTFRHIEKMTKISHSQCFNIWKRHEKANA